MDLEQRCLLQSKRIKRNAPDTKRKRENLLQFMLSIMNLSARRFSSYFIRFDCVIQTSDYILLSKKTEQKPVRNLEKYITV